MEKWKRIINYSIFVLTLLAFIQDTIKSEASIDNLDNIEIGKQGFIKVHLSPPEVLKSGAQWRIPGQEWRDSGDEISILPGLYRIQCKKIPGWKPIREITQVVSRE